MRNVCGWWNFYDLEVLPHFPVASSLLHELAGCNELSSGSDVEEEPVLEFDDSPGTAKGT